MESVWPYKLSKGRGKHKPGDCPLVEHYENCDSWQTWRTEISETKRDNGKANNLVASYDEHISSCEFQSFPIYIFTYFPMKLSEVAEQVPVYNGGAVKHGEHRLAKSLSILSNPSEGKYMLMHVFRAGLA